MRPSLSKQEERTLYVIGMAILGIVVCLWIFIRLTGITLDKIIPNCLFLQLTGLYCPGCGGTRAVSAFFHGHLLQSLKYHPLICYLAVVGGWYLLSHSIELISKGKAAIGMRYRDIYLYVAIAIVVINFIIKDFYILVYGSYLLG